MDLEIDNYATQKDYDWEKTKDKMERSSETGLGEKRPELDRCYKQESME